MVLVIALLVFLSFIVCKRLLVISQRLRTIGCSLLDLLGGFDLNIGDVAGRLGLVLQRCLMRHCSVVQLLIVLVLST